LRGVGKLTNLNYCLSHSCRTAFCPVTHGPVRLVLVEHGHLAAGDGGRG
jgi:hypothetical protein